MKHCIVIASTCCLLLIAVAGCERNTPPAEPPTAGGSMGTYSWSPSVSETAPVPGIDQAYIWAWLIGNKPVLLIWADVEKPDGKSVATQNGGFDGQLNDISIKFDGQTKTVSINGADYDMSRGSLFLISTQEDKPVVKQLNRNVAEVAVLKADGSGLDTTKLKALAGTDADIAAFFGRSPDKPKAP